MINLKKAQIAILTDFGVSDNYNGVMEGVIRKINPDVNIVYIAPSAKEFNLYAGSYLLYTSYRYFQRNTIFLVVIDPGVGTRRKAIIIKTKNYYFVGPDNGILYPAAFEDGIVEAVQITNQRMFLSKEISNTFHGRDIFSVAAAYLSLNVDMSIFGEKIKPEELEKLEFNFSETKEGDKIVYCGKVIYIDHFGNIATSIKVKMNENSKALAKFKGKEYQLNVVRTFGEAKGKELLLYNNGYGFLEIGINKGNAAITINAEEGDDICLEVYTQGDFNHSI